MLPAALAALALVAADPAPEQPLVAAPDLAAVRAAIEKRRPAERVEPNQPAIVCVGGAREFAMHSSREAVLAAIDLGARDVKVEVRLTLDSVPVAFPDPTLDRLLDGFGAVEELLWDELIFLTSKDRWHQEPKTQRVASLAELSLVSGAPADQLALLPPAARPPSFPKSLFGRNLSPPFANLSMTFFLGPRDDPALARYRGLFPVGELGYPWLDDADPSAWKRENAPSPGIFLVRDPRGALTAHGRRPRRVRADVRDMALPESKNGLERGPFKLEPDSGIIGRRSQAMYANLMPRATAAHAPRGAKFPAADYRRQLAWQLGMIAKHRRDSLGDEGRQALATLAGDSEPGVRADALLASARAGDKTVAPAILRDLATRRRRNREAKVDESGRKRKLEAEDRGRLCFALGLLRDGSPEAVAELTAAMLDPVPETTWDSIGVESASAAWSLGEIRDPKTVDALKKAVFAEHQWLKNAVDAKPDGFPPGWLDVKTREAALASLASIGTDEAMQAIESAMNTPAAQTKHLAPNLPELAAEALSRFRTPDRSLIFAKLLTHENPLVRRQGILGALREGKPQYRTVLELSAPWAVPWWDEEYGARR